MKASLKFTFLALLLSAFLVSFASAALVIIPTSAITVAANHNSDSSFTFQVNNTDGTNYTSISFSGTPSSALGSWTVPAAIALNGNEISSTLTATFHVNQYQSGTVNGVLTATSSAPAASDTQAYTININPTPAISVSETTKATKFYDGKFRMTNTGNTVLSGTLTPSTTGNAQISLNPSTYTIQPNSYQDIVTHVTDDGSGITFGNNPISIALSNPSQTFTANVYGAFCSGGPIGTNLSVSSIDITNDGSGDESTWNPLDKIKVKVEFENNGDTKVKSVKVEMGLFNSAGQKKTSSLTFLNSGNEKVDYGTLNDGDSDSETFEFQVPADLKEGDYTLGIKVYSDSTGQANLCAEDTTNKVSVEKQSDNGKYIAFDNIVISPTQATCGDTVTLSFDAYNVGDQDQDRVKISVLSTEMNLSQYSEITGGLNMGDSTASSLSFVVPAGLADKTYNIGLDAEYDYNKGVYRQGLDSNFYIPLKVFGCTPISTKIVSVAAEMVSQTAEAGAPLEIKTTLTNPTASAVTYTVAAKNYASWADSVALSDDTVTLKAGESKDITMTFQIAKDAAEGDQTFDVQVSANGKTDSKEVVVGITKPSTGLSSLLSGNSAMFWIIIAANVILIILIIVVAVRLSR